MHRPQHWHASVGVVVDADRGLAFLGAHESTGVLDEPAPKRDGERKEESVKLWRVEAFAEVLAGCDDHDPYVSRAAGVRRTWR